MATATSSEVKAQAYRAAVKFRQMIPTLTAYARNISGNPKLRIEATSHGARTDGKTIYLTPPFEMGSSLQHDKTLCDKRSQVDLLMRCDACRVHEEVMVNVYHEIAHNAFGSFDTISPRTIQSVAASVLAEAGRSKFIETAQAKIQGSGGYLSYAAAANMVSPHLSTLSNVLDDVRINQRMFEARPGMKNMFVADEMRMALTGLSIVNPETGELTVRKYSELPRDAQVCTALYWAGAGYTMSDIFSDEIADTLEDEKLRDILARTPGAKNMEIVFGLSIEALIRLRELGYLKAPNDPAEDEGLDGGSGDPSDQSQSADIQPQDGPQSDDGASGDPQPTDGAPGRESQIPDLESDDEPQGGDDGSDVDDDGHASGDEQTPQDSGDEGSSSGGGSSDPGEQGSSDEAEPDDEDSSSEAGAGDDQSYDEGDSDSEPSSHGDAEGDGPDEGDEPSEGSDSPQSGTDAEPDDSSQDDGTPGSNGGRDPDSSEPDESDPEEVAKIVQIFLGHANQDSGDPVSDEELEEMAEDIAKAMVTAVNQAHHFDQPAKKIGGVTEIQFDDSATKAWDAQKRYYYETDVSELLPPESIMGSALLKTRVTFSENKRARHLQDLKAGKVNTRVLGKRAHLGDDRLFRRKQIPGKRDYFVLIGIDVSGSTASGQLRNIIIKAAFAQAELLYRVGVKFAIYAHSGGYASGVPWGDGDEDYNLEIFKVKEPDQPWDDKAKERLANLVPYSANVDGHTLEFYRKVLDKRTETDRIIMYYTDGAMPHMNYEEELEVLEREIKTCRQRRYTLMGVGIQTDSPTAHGLDTVQIDTMDDLPKVIQHLDKQLIRKS